MTLCLGTLPSSISGYSTWGDAAARRAIQHARERRAEAGGRRGAGEAAQGERLGRGRRAWKSSERCRLSGSNCFVTLNPGRPIFTVFFMSCACPGGVGERGSEESRRRWAGTSGEGTGGGARRRPLFGRRRDGLLRRLPRGALREVLLVPSALREGRESPRRAQGGVREEALVVWARDTRPACFVQGNPRAAAAGGEARGSPRPGARLRVR